MDRESKTVDSRRVWRRWNEGRARAALDELSKSGESAAQFARRKGISTQRLLFWKRRLAATGVAAFVRVPLRVATRSTAQPAREHIEIALEGVTVRVREDLDVDHLARIVDALARRSRRC